MFFLAAALILAAAPSAHAADSPWTKFGRGFQNTLSGWMEIFYQPSVIHAEGKSWPVALPAGLLKGIPWGIARTGAGIYELVTFPFPVPEGYKPLMRPESILSKDYRDYDEETGS
jgi:putative exosortase-associated protein (TIGR04073 family)